MGENNLEEMSFLLKLISDRTRLKMLAHLKNGEMCVCEFVDLFEISQPAISQHLKKLRTAGIIVERKQAPWVYYRLSSDLPEYISDMIRALPAVRFRKCDCQESKSPLPLELSK